MPFLSPPLTADEQLRHAKEVKRCRGAACYGALAAHFGTHSPKELEWQVDGRAPYDSHGDPSISNKYRRWRQGKSLPSDDSVTHVAKRSSGCVQLAFWRDLPLWELLAPDPPPMQRIHHLLETASPSIQRILFPDHIPGEEESFHDPVLSRGQTLAIRDLHSLDAFITLLGLARKGESIKDGPAHFLPSACAFDLLPRMLHSYSPLCYDWENLFHCLDRIFWKRSYPGGIHFELPIDVVRSSLCTLDADPGAELPQISGL